MPSITLMMSAILWLAAEMVSMLWTTCPMTCSPCSAALRAAWAIWLACWAESAVCLTVPVSSLMAALVDSRLLAALTVRSLKSWLPEAICAEALDTMWMEPRSSPRMWIQPSRAWFRAFMQRPISSSRLVAQSAVRSPSANDRAIISICSTGRTMLRTVSTMSHRPMRVIKVTPLNCSTIRRVMSLWRSSNAALTWAVICWVISACWSMNLLAWSKNSWACMLTIAESLAPCIMAKVWVEKFCSDSSLARDGRTSASFKSGRRSAMARRCVFK